MADRDGEVRLDARVLAALGAWKAPLTFARLRAELGAVAVSGPALDDALWRLRGRGLVRVRAVVGKPVVYHLASRPL